MVRKDSNDSFMSDLEDLMSSIEDKEETKYETGLYGTTIENEHGPKHDSSISPFLKATTPNKKAITKVQPINKI